MVERRLIHPIFFSEFAATYSLQFDGTGRMVPVSSHKSGMGDLVNSEVKMDAIHPLSLNVHIARSHLLLPIAHLPKQERRLIHPIFFSEFAATYSLQFDGTGRMVPVSSHKSGMGDLVNSEVKMDIYIYIYKLYIYDI